MSTIPPSRPHRRVSSLTNVVRLRGNTGNSSFPAVRVIPPDIEPRVSRHHDRITEFQVRWGNIKEELPPQLSRRHITMISIGGVIGTGVFLGISDGLRHGGPLGLLLGYTIVGSIVYSVVVSIGEMISFLPNVGGVVGLADLYVDPALGFAMGWNAWYNWAIILPAEISAAVILTNSLFTLRECIKWDESIANKCIQWGQRAHAPDWLNLVLTTIILVVAVGINCMGTRWYGETEFWFASIKVITIIGLILLVLVIDLGGGNEGFVGFRYWRDPGPFAQYLDIQGWQGRFLGFWSVLMQASFSFFGAEVPGIAAGEVVDPTHNIPHAIRRVWIRISLFYILSVFAAGLVVAHNDIELSGGTNDPMTSPFVIAMKNAGIKVLPRIVTVAFITSAWSAAASDVYISSRYLYFLARCHHAPRFFGLLYRRRQLVEEPTVGTPKLQPTTPSSDQGPRASDVLLLSPNYISGVSSSSSDFGAGGQYFPTTEAPIAAHMQSSSSGDLSPALPDPSSPPMRDRRSSFDNGPLLEDGSPGLTPRTPASERDVNEILPGVHRRGGDADKTVPWVGVLVAASIAFSAYLATTNPKGAFRWLAAMSSAAALQAWICMLYTYTRWHQGVSFAERKKRFIPEIAILKENRSRFQPYLAYYALVMCILILIFNGWAVFTQHWEIAQDFTFDSATGKCDLRELHPTTDSEFQPIIPIFITSYLPIPLFLLLLFGYKLIMQTVMVPLENMSFSRKGVPPVKPEPLPTKTWEKILHYLF